MGTSILKSINLSLIATPDSHPHFEQGIKDYIYPIDQGLHLSYPF